MLNIRMHLIFTFLQIAVVALEIFMICTWRCVGKFMLLSCVCERENERESKSKRERGPLSVYCEFYVNFNRNAEIL